MVPIDMSGGRAISLEYLKAEIWCVLGSGRHKAMCSVEAGSGGARSNRREPKVIMYRGIVLFLHHELDYLSCSVNEYAHPRPQGKVDVPPILNTGR